MNKETILKKLWKDPVWSKVISVGVLSIIISLGAYLTGAWPSIKNFLLDTWNFIISSSSIPNWLIGILSLLSVLVITGFFFAIKEKSKNDNSIIDWKSYRSDHFFMMKWRWTYNHNKITTINSFCPECDYQIFPKESLSFGILTFDYICEDCGYNSNLNVEDPNELKHKVSLKIQKKLRNNDWG
jgi:hypothetical protein